MGVGRGGAPGNVPGNVGKAPCCAALTTGEESAETLRPFDAADSWLILVADSCAPSTLLARYVLYTAVPVLQ